MDYSILNKKTYDDLADEYEKRAFLFTNVIEKVMNYLSKYIKPGSSILDVGCGVGMVMHIFSKNGFKVTGIEISPKMRKFAQQRNPKTKIILGDFLKTKFDNKFDAVLTFAFIHLFPKRIVPTILNKIKLILRRGGVALISSTKSSVSKEGWVLKNDFTKKRKRFRKSWTENELRESLKKADFKILALKKFKDPLGKVWMEFVVQK